MQGSHEIDKAPWFLFRGQSHTAGHIHTGTAFPPVRQVDREREGFHV